MTVNCKDERGNTALHQAAATGLLNECMCLVQGLGADYRILNDAGMRPKDLAVNIEEQYLTVTNTVDYGKVIEYLGRVERDACGRESFYYFKDNYHL
jgi:hypothetical protein